jgi:hypothetical protein
MATWSQVMNGTVTNGLVTWANAVNGTLFKRADWDSNYTTNNVLWLNTTNNTYHAYNSSGLIKDWNSTGLIKDFNASGLITNYWNANYSTFLTHVTWANAINGTLFTQAAFNTNYTANDAAYRSITNTSYVPFTGAANNLVMNSKNITNISYIGIGQSSPLAPLEINVSGVNTLLRGYGDINGYAELNIWNKNTGASASSDVVATASNGDSTNYYIDMGINGQAYSVATWTINGADDGYLYTQNGSMAVGTSSTGKNLTFFTGGTLAANERVRIDSTGKVGINTTSLNSALNIGGNANLTFNNMTSVNCIVFSNGGTWCSA